MLFFCWFHSFQFHQRDSCTPRFVGFVTCFGQGMCCFGIWTIGRLSLLRRSSGCHKKVHIGWPSPFLVVPCRQNIQHAKQVEKRLFCNTAVFLAACFFYPYYIIISSSFERSQECWNEMVKAAKIEVYWVFTSGYDRPSGGFKHFLVLSHLSPT